jgi:hypothetical protein
LPSLPLTLGFYLKYCPAWNERCDRLAIERTLVGRSEADDSGSSWQFLRIALGVAQPPKKQNTLVREMEAPLGSLGISLLLNGERNRQQGTVI